MSSRFPFERCEHCLSTNAITHDGQYVRLDSISLSARLLILPSLSLSSRNACCEQDTSKIQTEIIRTRAAQYQEPSARRGSIGVSARRPNNQGRFVRKQL